MATRTLKGEIVNEHLDKFPTTPSSTLAKKIYKENPTVFSNIDQVRNTVRYYRGKCGSNNRKLMSENKHTTDTYKIPESEAEESKFLIIPSKNNNIAILGDIHVPYHAKPQLEKALQYITDNPEINTIYLNGDSIDFYSLSRYEKDPRKRDLVYELDCLAQLLGYIRQTFPDHKIYYKEGNHEMRLKKYLLNKAPELFNLPTVQLDTLLKLRDFNIELVGAFTIAKAGKFHILHGHEYLGGGTVYPAKALFEKMGVDGCCGHFHRCSDFRGNSLDRTIRVYSMGCLAELNPDYMPFQKQTMSHVHGFGHLVFSKDDFTFKNIRL